MLIGKRISFSLDGVWTEWDFRRHARTRINMDFSTVETPLYLNQHADVNTILTHFLRLPSPRGIGRRETTAQRDATARTRSGANSVRDRTSSPVVDRENPGSGERFYGLGGGVGRGLGPGEDRGVGVGLGVG